MPTAIEGITNVMRRLKEVAAAHPEAVGAGLFSVGNEIMAVAKDRCPVDQGVLRASGYVEARDTSDGTVVVELGFGGAAASYAVKQHEDLTLRHPGGGQAKFLESAIDDARAGMAARVAAVARQHIEAAASKGG